MSDKENKNVKVKKPETTQESIDLFNQKLLELYPWMNQPIIPTITYDESYAGQGGYFGSLGISHKNTHMVSADYILANPHLFTEEDLNFAQTLGKGMRMESPNPNFMNEVKEAIRNHPDYDENETYLSRLNDILSMGTQPYIDLASENEIKRKYQAMHNLDQDSNQI